MNWGADQEEQLPEQVSTPSRRARRARRRGARPRGANVRHLHGNLQGRRGAPSASVPASLSRKVKTTAAAAAVVRLSLRYFAVGPRT